jgi:hypothetical protein
MVVDVDWGKKLLILPPEQFYQHNHLVANGKDLGKENYGFCI